MELDLSPDNNLVKKFKPSPAIIRSHKAGSSRLHTLIFGLIIMLMARSSYEG